MKTRIVQTRFWEDAFIATLDVKGKFLFIYLLTNKRLELTGAYELPLKYISLETGLTLSEVKKALNDISPKILYIDEYIIILNHKKYQDYSHGNENQQKAYSKEFNNLPEKIKDLLLNGLNQLVVNQFPTSCQLDINNKTEIRNNKTEIRKEIKNYKSPLDIKDPDLEEIATQLNISIKDAKRKLEDLLDAVESNPKKYKYENYKATLRNWIKRGIDDGKIKQLPPKPEESDDPLIRATERHQKGQLR